MATEVMGCNGGGPRQKGENVHGRDEFERAYAGRQPDYYRPLAKRCVMYGMPGKWLDLGSGLGLFVECLRREGVDCTGLEGSEYGVAVANDCFPGVDVRHHYLEDSLPFEDGAISTVTCLQTIEHLDQKTVSAMLAECHRVLVPGGVMIIYSPCRYDPEQSLEETHINLYTPSSLRLEVERAGFKVIKSNNSPRPLLGKSRAASYIVLAVLKAFRVDRLSATANCVAKKC